MSCQKTPIYPPELAACRGRSPAAYLMPSSFDNILDFWLVAVQSEQDEIENYWAALKNACLVRVGVGVVRGMAARESNAIASAFPGRGLLQSIWRAAVSS